MLSVCFRFLLELYKKGNTTRTLIQEVVDGTTMLFSEHSDLLKDMMQTEKVESQDMVNFVDAMKSPFLGLDTEYKRMKEFQRLGMIVPRSHIAGTRYETTNGAKELVNNTFEYVSVIETIATVINITQLNCSATPCHGQDNRMLNNFTNGSRFATNQLLATHPEALQIILYHDDIELANPLGSKAGINKLTMIYMYIVNSGSQSKLYNIHLVGVAHASDIKEFGFQKILNPLYEDLQKLESGVEIAGKTVWACLTHIIGDNLAVNQILGLVQSFSADHFCRFCTMSKAETQKATMQNPDLFRTSAMHTDHLVQIDDDPSSSRHTGVKSSLILNNLKHFHGIEAATADVMHDILEGTAKLELQLILQHFIKMKKITLESFNVAIDQFNYGLVCVVLNTRALVR